MDTVNSENKDLYFKGQQAHETFICFFRQHWVTLVREFVYSLIFAFVVIITLIYFQNIQALLRGNVELKLFFLTAFLISTVYLHRFFLRMLNHFVNVGIITDIRVIDHEKTLFFHDMVEAVDMAQIQNIERISEGFFANILKYGDIKIFLNASDAILTFKRIPNAKYIFRCISREKEARQEALAANSREHQTLEQDPSTSPLPKVSAK